MQISITVIFESILSFLDRCGQACLKYSRLEVRIVLAISEERISCEVDVVHAEHKCLLQGDSIFLMGLAKHAQISPVNLQYLFDILRRGQE